MVGSTGSCKISDSLVKYSFGCGINEVFRDLNYFVLVCGGSSQISPSNRFLMDYNDFLNYCLQYSVYGDLGSK